MGNTNGGPPVQILVLGPVEVDRAAPRGRANTLVSASTWLALHPGAAGCQMDRALQMSPESRMSTLSRMRAWLGSQNLPTSRDGHYRLNAVTDFAAFQALLCTPTGQLRPRCTDHELWSALQLVRGEPLADVDSVWGDGERLQMSLLIADVALLLAERALRRGSTRQAHLAMSRGLLVGSGGQLGQGHPPRSSATQISSALELPPEPPSRVRHSPPVQGAWDIYPIVTLMPMNYAS